MAGRPEHAGGDLGPLGEPHRNRWGARRNRKHVPCTTPGLRNYEDQSIG